MRRSAAAPTQVLQIEDDTEVDDDDHSEPAQALEAAETTSDAAWPSAAAAPVVVETQLPQMNLPTQLLGRRVSVKNTSKAAGKLHEAMPNCAESRESKITCSPASSASAEVSAVTGTDVASVAVKTHSAVVSEGLSEAQATEALDLACGHGELGASHMRQS